MGITVEETTNNGVYTYLVLLIKNYIMPVLPTMLLYPIRKSVFSSYLAAGILIKPALILCELYRAGRSGSARNSIMLGTKNYGKE